MTECYQTSIEFPSVKRRKVEADFSGGAITSNAGITLLSQVDRHLGLSRSVARAVGDTRRQASCDHSLPVLLRQRLYGLALGYEDLNDHKELRHDLALQTAVVQDDSLASASTLCRLEQRADRQTAVAMHQVLFDQLVQAHKTPPKRLTVPLPMPMSRIRKTPDEVVDVLDQLLETDTDDEAAARLNELGHRNWQGQAFTKKKVSLIRHTYGLRSRYERLRALGYITAGELAIQLEVSNTTIHTWGRNGILERGLCGNSRRCLYLPPKGMVVVKGKGGRRPIPPKLISVQLSAQETV